MNTEPGGSPPVTRHMVTVWRACSEPADPARTRAMHRATVREVLRHALGNPSCDVAWTAKPGGKPILRPCPSPHCPPCDAMRSDRTRLHFNVSHTGSHLFVATSAEGPLGIDAEGPRWLRDPEAVAASMLAPRERSVLDGQEPAARNATLLRVWTRKEALLKAEGVGLARSPASLEVDLSSAADPTGPVEAARPVSAHPVWHSLGWPWQLYDLPTGDGLHLSLATWGPARVVRRDWTGPIRRGCPRGVTGATA